MIRRIGYRMVLTRVIIVGAWQALSGMVGMGGADDDEGENIGSWQMQQEELEAGNDGGMGLDN